MKNITTTLLFFLGLVLSSSANVTVINGLTHVHQGVSGERIQGELIVINTSKVDQSINLELSDAHFSCTADRTFSSDSSHMQSSMTWLTLPFQSMVLAAGERRSIPYEVQIPSDLPGLGSFWSVIMVNVDQPIAERVMENNLGLSSKIRYAIGVITHINEPSGFNLSFTGASMDKNKLELEVQNQGTYLEGVKITLEIYNNSSELVDVISTDRNMVFPGFCRKYLLDLSMIPSGSYQVIVVANNKKEYVGTTVELNL